MVKQAPLKLRDQQICVSVLLPNKAYFTPPTRPSIAQHSPRIHWAAAMLESVTKAYLQGC